MQTREAFISVYVAKQKKNKWKDSRLGLQIILVEQNVAHIFSDGKHTNELEATQF